MSNVIRNCIKIDLLLTFVRASKVLYVKCANKLKNDNKLYIKYFFKHK